MKYLLIILFIATAISGPAAAQHDDHIMVHIFGAYDDDTAALIGANVYWANTTEGTASDETGIAHLPVHHHLPHQLVVSYIGFYNDTLTVTDPDKRHYYVFLINVRMLNAVEVVQKRKTQFVSSIETIKTEFIGEDELKRAACCDLSESFETNASVDVSYSDAVTGAKEIRLLGLDGVYVEMLQEKVPSLRGLAVPFGLSYVPGPWVNSIYVSKGAGTVLNGHESITGSINYKYKMPLEADPFYLDLFGNHRGRYEGNVIGAWQIGERTGSVLAFNAGGQHSRADNNDDGFIDQPLYERYNVMNRWKITGNRANTQFMVNYLRDERLSGETNFQPELHKGEGQVYGIGLTTNRVEAYGKTGFFFDDKPAQNIGTLYSFNYHDTEGYFGNRVYTGKQFSFNGTFLFQTIFRTTDHGFTAGANFHSDHYEETFEDIALNDDEWNVGAFAEYTYNFTDKVKLVAGFRMDYHSEYDIEFSPRLHFKWTPHPLTTVRASAGRGFRSARILGENISLMASSRDFVIVESPGLEAAWNTGISMVQKFSAGEREGYIGLDYYYTTFSDQVIADVNQENNRVSFYNLDGRSYANSILAEVSLEVAEGLDVKVAYKIDDVKVTLNGELQAKPFNYLHKGLLVAAYTSPNNSWQVDMNLDLHGKHRLPSSFSNSDHSRFSPFFVQLNVQVSKFLDNGIELYAGGENITNYRQKDPIIGADDPFGDMFDTAQVWGPVVGGVFYAGLRYQLARKGK
jgi:hypothetical protein